jgi:hypothetical protein
LAPLEPRQTASQIPMIDPKIVVRRLLEAGDMFAGVRRLPRQNLTDELLDYFTGLPRVELADGDYYFVDTTTNRIFYAWSPHEHGWQFRSPQELTNFLADYETTGEAAKHHFEPEPEPAEIPMERKMKHKVWQEGHWLIIKLPAEEDFIHREGWNMKHCLGVKHVAADYCKRMARGDQDQYSLIDLRDQLPKVNFEVSHTRSSYGGEVNEPGAITQIRGMANQCPPKDEYLYPLMAFFKEHPEWKVSGHGIRSFDYGIDGDKVMARWKELQNE